MTPSFQCVDHIHVYVSDRASTEIWYANVLGFTRVKELDFWATNNGPLTISDTSGKIHIALFERPFEKCRSTIAFAASAAEFLNWKTHLSALLNQPPEMQDHDVSWSLYFRDLDGNPYEITSYEYDVLAASFGKYPSV